MEVLCKDLTLGFYNEFGIYNIPISQYDIGRIISISFANQGEIFEIPDDTIVFLKALKPDGKEINTDQYCYVNRKENTVEICVFNQLSIAAGVVKCEIILANSEGQRYTSSHFNLVVNRPVSNDDHLKSMDQYRDIVGILVEIEGLRSELISNSEIFDENDKIRTDKLYEASTEKKGIVKLVDSVESDSTIDAATPNSVKKINDSLNNTNNLIAELATRLNTLADSDDTTLDQLSEIVAYIKSNKSLIDSITTSKISVSDIIDNLTSADTNKPLSAKQGKVLKDLIDALTTTIPKVNNGILTIQKNGTNIQTFTANQSTNVTANITVPTKTSELTNDSGFVTAGMSTLPVIIGSINSGMVSESLSLYGITADDTALEVFKKIPIGYMVLIDSNAQGNNFAYSLPTPNDSKGCLKLFTNTDGSRGWLEWHNYGANVYYSTVVGGQQYPWVRTIGNDDVLTTEEQLSTNTEPSKVVSALVVKEMLNNVFKKVGKSNIWLGPRWGRVINVEYCELIGSVIHAKFKIDMLYINGSTQWMATINYAIQHPSVTIGEAVAYVPSTESYYPLAVFPSDAGNSLTIGYLSGMPAYTPPGGTYFADAIITAKIAVSPG